MLIFVITFNLGLTLLNLYLAYCLGRWRWRLGRAADRMNCLEQYCDRLLKDAPQQIEQGQRGSRDLRGVSAQLLQSVSQAQSLLGVISWGWRWKFPTSRQKWGQKSD